MNSPERDLVFEFNQWTLMELEVSQKAPEEACGIVAGEGNRVKLVIPVTNALHSTSRFRMEPKEELDAFYQAEMNGLDILAIYHSHPNGPPRPSEIDIRELTFPGIVYLIWYRISREWRCSGYLMNSPDNIVNVHVRVEQG
jgi:proteasome lid subunit RPN8/RPN11